MLLILQLAFKSIQKCHVLGFLSFLLFFLDKVFRFQQRMSLSQHRSFQRGVAVVWFDILRAYSLVGGGVVPVWLEAGTRRNILLQEVRVWVRADELALRCQTEESFTWSHWLHLGTQEWFCCVDAQGRTLDHGDIVGFLYLHVAFVVWEFSPNR